MTFCFPGGRLISLNNISLEGVTFGEAAEVIQNSPEEVQLIVSQPKGAPPSSAFKDRLFFTDPCLSSLVFLSPLSLRSSSLRNCESHATLTADGRSADESPDELVAMTPKTCNRLHIPREVLGAQV